MPALDPAAFQAQVAAGAVPLDLRPPDAFAPAHVRGAVWLQFGRHDLAERAGLFLPADPVYVLIMEPAPLGPVPEQMLAGAGYRVAGFLAGGMEAWQAAGLPTDSTPVITVGELLQRVQAGAASIIDVREDYEFAFGHIPGSRLIPHGQIWARAAEVDPGQHWYVVCNSQVRSGACASILRRLGFRRVTLVLGGTTAWAEAGYGLAP